MQVKELSQDGLNYEIEIVIAANDIDTRVDQKLEEARQSVRIPGFRPGKVPLAIMKKRYGRNVMGEVLEAAVNETSQKALDDKKLKAAVQPKIEVKEFDEGKDLKYVMNVEVLPEIKIADYKGLKFTKLVAKPEKKAVDEALAKIAESNQDSKEIESKRATKDGDIVDINFAGRTADDNVEHPGMQADGHKLTLGSGQFIPGFEEQLIGKKAGSKVEVKVSFPEEYGAAELAGRDAIFDVEINAIHEAVTPEIDDAFAQKLGLEDLKALKAAVEEQTGKEFESHSKMLLKKELLDMLDELHSFEIPKTMEEMEFENIKRQVQMENQSRGVTEEISEDDEAELKEIAQRRVRLGLILSEIGNENNITVPDADLQKAVIMEAQKYPGQEKEVFDYYSKNRQALESLRAPVFEEKVVDFILELAEVKDKEVKADELMAEDVLGEKSKDKKDAKKKPAAKKEKAKKDDAAKDKKPTAKKKAPAKKKSAKKE